MKLTTVKLTRTTVRHHQAIATTTSHAHLTSSTVPAPTSRSSSASTGPSPQPPSATAPVRHKKPSRKHVFVSPEAARSAMLWSTAGVKGAIVALTLGIIVTVLTLVYIGCHYRRQRKISRRHRHLPVGSNDADYLVNGMYL